jgi:hypothetical protein
MLVETSNICRRAKILCSRPVQFKSELSSVGLTE